MPQRRSHIVTLDLTIEDTGCEPSYLQIYRKLRAMILEGRLAPGARLMSSRSYADILGRSRNTIAAAYELLLSEGLIESRRGSGTFVAREPADYSKSLASLPDCGRAIETRAPVAAELSPFGRHLVESSDLEIGGGRQFDTEGPDRHLFPFKEWGRLLRRVWQKPNPRTLFDFDPAGFRPLREQIAEHLAAHRAVRCTPDDILITAGALHGLDLVTRLLLRPGDRVLFEEPGYVRGRSLFEAAGMDVVAVPVDDDGMQVETALATANGAKLAFVTPSRQSPTGAVMSVERRQKLLNWATESKAWIFEDDYDSEFRLDGVPLRSIQSFDNESRVIYAGSLSKIMFVGLRLGYLVLPPGLQPLFARARRSLDIFPSSVAQPALALFFQEGFFAAHVNRMRRVYAERRTLLVRQLHLHLGDLLEVKDGQGGIVVAARFRPSLPPGLSDVAISKAASAAGLYLQPLSIFYKGEERQQGLVFGLAIVDDTALERNLLRLRAIILAAGQNSG